MVVEQLDIDCGVVIRERALIVPRHGVGDTRQVLTTCYNLIEAESRPGARRGELRPAGPRTRLLARGDGDVWSGRAAECDTRPESGAEAARGGRLPLTLDTYHLALKQTAHATVTRPPNSPCRRRRTRGRTTSSIRNVLTV